MNLPEEEKQVHEITEEVVQEGEVIEDILKSGDPDKIIQDRQNLSLQLFQNFWLIKFTVHIDVCPLHQARRIPHSCRSRSYFP